MFNWRLKLILLLAQALCSQAGYIGGDISAGLHSVGLLGSYAGALSGGETLSKLDFGVSGGDHEELGELGEHLSEHSFPVDYGSSDAGVEYAEASEHIAQYEPELEELHHHEHHHHEEPVPGIDHGKGAFSYSSLYEFKDREEHEKHHQQHQQEEEHVQQQMEHEHQQHMLDHHLDFH